MSKIILFRHTQKRMMHLAAQMYHQYSKTITDITRALSAIRAYPRALFNENPVSQSQISTLTMPWVSIV